MDSSPLISKGGYNGVPSPESESTAMSNRKPLQIRSESEPFAFPVERARVDSENLGHFVEIRVGE